MTKNTKKPTKSTKPVNTKKIKLTFWGKHPYAKYVVIGIIILFFVVLCLMFFSKAKVYYQQWRLQPFYNTADISTEGPLGEVVRQEPLKTNLKNGTAHRILYRTQRSDGTNTISSGMILIPNTPAPEGGRSVIAWAHGTIGLGDQCAPSRQPDPLGGSTWPDEMLKNGWVVTGTDYAGLGTPGISEYLVGKAESNDVINSVRAARNFEGAEASSQYAVWGHSQGGNSALFTGANSASYAPELQLLGTAATAPAAELSLLFEEQSNTPMPWVIGPEVALAWPSGNPELNVDQILTELGKRTYKKIANQCVEQAALEGLIRTNLKQEFFTTDVTKVPEWNAELNKQSAPILPASQPVFVAESTTDNVVLPNTTARYIVNACQAGSNLTSVWLTDVNHVELADVISPDVITWIQDRFTGAPATSNCSEAPPVAPAS